MTKRRPPLPCVPLRANQSLALPLPLPYRRSPTRTSCNSTPPAAPSLSDDFRDAPPSSGHASIPTQIPAETVSNLRPATRYAGEPSFAPQPIRRSSSIIASGDHLHRRQCLHHAPPPTQPSHLLPHFFTAAADLRLLFPCPCRSVGLSHFHHRNQLTPTSSSFSGHPLQADRCLALHLDRRRPPPSASASASITQPSSAAVASPCRHLTAGLQPPSTGLQPYLRPPATLLLTPLSSVPIHLPPSLPVAFPANCLPRRSIHFWERCSSPSSQLTGQPLACLIQIQHP